MGNESFKSLMLTIAIVFLVIVLVWAEVILHAIVIILGAGTFLAVWMFVHECMYGNDDEWLP